MPADGALYALRDATATVASIPLIAASIMSKKLAVETDLILLDVKAGGGAFMKTPDAAAELAEACVSLAAGWDRPCRAAVTDMSQPLGTAVGNALDVAEAIRVLRGDEAGRLRDLAVLFAARALTILDGRRGGRGAGRRRAGAGRRARGGDVRGDDRGAGRRPPGGRGSRAGCCPPRRCAARCPRPRDGWLAAVDAEAVGRAAMALGAGRVRKGDPVDPAVGVEFFPKVGDGIRAGDVRGPCARARRRTRRTRRPGRCWRR